MSLTAVELNPDEDLTLTSNDSLDPSISLSLGDFSVRIKDNVKDEIQPRDQCVDSHEKIDEKKWSLKRPDMKLGISNCRKSDNKTVIPMEKNSMDEFLEKEKECKTQKSEGAKDNDDTSCDILASVAFDKYPSDFENATDDDIGSIFEQMSKIVSNINSNSVHEHTTSSDASKHLTVEELLQEAEVLVRNNCGQSRSNSKSENLNQAAQQINCDYSDKDYDFETDLFQRMEEEVHRQTEIIRKSPKNDKHHASPDCVMVYENINTLKPPRTLKMQKKRFEEQKVEISSSSDLDDPIERHSKSEDIKNVKKSLEDKDNLQKEIIDVDKDFFNSLLRKSAEKAEGKISGSSSFGQEEFSQVLKILQTQSDKENGKIVEKLTIGNHSINNLPSDPNDLIFPEKEITELLERELNKVHGSVSDHAIVDYNSNMKKEHAQKLKKNLKDDGPQSSNKDCAKFEIKTNSHNELYAVDLTPRLELFADTIPKLMAEKSIENIEKTAAESIQPTNATADVAKKQPKNSITTSTKNMRPSKPSEKKIMTKSNTLNPSRSYDQLAKRATSFKSSLDDVRNSRSADTLKKNYSSKNPQPKSKITVKPSSAISTIASKIKFSVKPTVQKSPINSKFPGMKHKTVETVIKHSLAGGDSRRNYANNDWEILCHEERHKNFLLKDQIESEAKLYKQQIESMRTSFEEELFALKKHNIILKAKIDELLLNEKREKRTEIPSSKTDTRVLLLEKELEKQESLIRTYETENKRLIVEIKQLQEELKQLEEKQRNHDITVNTNENLKLNEIIKDLREEILKLNFELSDLREKNSDAAMKNDDIVQQNCLIQEELNMFKEQLRTKDKFITDKLQRLSSDETEMKRKMEDMRIELSSKTEKLRLTKLEFDQFQQAVVPLEKELLELRVIEENLQEKLKISRSHVEREKVLTQKLKDQVILDNKKILDLNRQVREMERILKRKNPDSVSALILTAKSDHERINLEKIKLLEDRVASLEGEGKAKEEINQEKLCELQRKFGEMKEKYMAQVVELEEKLSAANAKERKIFNDMFTQTTIKCMENKGVEAKRDEKMTTPTEKDEKKDVKSRDANKIGPKSQNSKEDTHLIATIRGLKTELINKDKIITKLTKDFQELQKTNRRLQKEREKLLNDRRNFRPGDFEKGIRSTSGGSDPRLSSAKTPETNDQNSNVYQNGNFSNTNIQKLSGSSHRLYDPLQYSENGDNATIKKLHDENEILKEELNKMNKDFLSLKNKRLHDLNLLQEEHEREVATLVKEYSVKFGDSKVVKLQGQINTQVAVISHLKQQVEKLRDYKEQVIVLKVEREHLENKIKILNEKVKYLVTPGTEQLQLLQEKITQLQQRHETREMTLQNLVRDLLRNKTQCHDCKGEKGKNKQLCYFRQELDHILAMLQEIAHVQ